MTTHAYGVASDAGVTRRRLLVAGGATLAAAALADAGQIVAVATRLASPGAGFAAGAAPAYLRRSTYTGLVGEQFELAAAGGRASGRLIAVDDLPRPGPAATSPTADDAFALVFHMDGGARLRDDIMTVTHPSIGAFPLFVSRTGAGRHGQEYAAIINRVSRSSGESHVRTLPR